MKSNFTKRMAHGYIVMLEGVPCVFDEHGDPTIKFRGKDAMVFPNYNAARNFKRRYARLLLNDGLIGYSKDRIVRVKKDIEKSINSDFKIIRLV